MSQQYAINRRAPFRSVNIEEQNASNRFQGTKPGLSTTGSVSVTVEAGANRIMVVSTSGDGFLTGLARDSQNFTSAGTLSHSFVRAQIWYLVNPNTGTNNLVGTGSSLEEVDFGGTIYNNVDQTTPLTSEQTDTSSGATSVTISDTIAVINKFITALCVADFGSGVTPGAGQTEIWNNTLSGVFTGSMSDEQGNGGTTSSDYSFTFSDAAYIGFTLNAA